MFQSVLLEWLTPYHINNQIFPSVRLCCLEFSSTESNCRQRLKVIEEACMQPLQLPGSVNLSTQEDLPRVQG